METLKELIQYNEEKLHHLKNYANLIEARNKAGNEEPHYTVDNQLIELEEFIHAEYNIELDDIGNICN